MSVGLRLTILGIGAVFFILVYGLLIKKKVSERLTLLWSFVALVAFIFVLFPRLLNRLANWADVSYPPALLFLVTILLLMLLVMYQSTQISVMDQRLREVGRAVALLRHEVTRLRNLSVLDNHLQINVNGGPTDRETEFTE